VKSSGTEVEHAAAAAAAQQETQKQEHEYLAVVRPVAESAVAEQKWKQTRKKHLLETWANTSAKQEIEKEFSVLPHQSSCIW